MPHALGGLRVLDFTTGMGGALVGLILADYGAEVVKVEAPEGDATRQMPAFYLWHRGKKSVVLDLHRPEDRARARTLARAADVLVHNFRRPALERFGLTYAELAGDNPGLVYCTIGGLGLRGKYADVKAYEGIVAAKMGMLQPNPLLSRREGPVYVTTPAATFCSAQLALQGILAALYVREDSGRGQEVGTSLLHGVTCYDTIEGLYYFLARRQGQANTRQATRAASADAPLMPSAYSLLVAPSADGYWFQFANIGGPHMWKAFVKALGLEWTFDDPELKEALAVMPPLGPAFRAEAKARRFYTLVLEALRAHTLAEWKEIFLQDENIGFEVFYTTQEAIDHPQLRISRQIAALDDPRVGPTVQLGPLVVMDATPANTGRPAPDLGADTAEILSSWTGNGRLSPPGEGDDAPRGRDAGTPSLAGPLTGVLALELATYFAAPFGLTLLAELGARVIKIEPLTGDPMRNSMPVPDTGIVKAIQGKESLAVDLSTEAGRAIVYALAKKADLALCSWRAGMAKSLGVDDAALRAINPNLIYHYGTSYGVEGPYTKRPAYAPTATAVAGLAEYQGGPEVPPAAGTQMTLEEVKQMAPRVRAANGLMANGDTHAALAVGTALLLGLLARRRTGLAQRTLTTMIASNGLVASDDFLRYAGKPPRRLPDAGLHGMGPTYRLYEAQAGWVFLACLKAKEWVALAAALREATAGRLDLAADARFATAAGREQNAEALVAALSEAFRARTAAEWEDFLLARDIACVEVNSQHYIDLLFDLENPLLRENGLIEEVDDPMFGRRPRIGPVIELSHTPARSGLPATTGRHTRAILHELGYSESQIEDLIARRIVRV